MYSVFTATWELPGLCRCEVLEQPGCASQHPHSPLERNDELSVRPLAFPPVPVIDPGHKSGPYLLFLKCVSPPPPLRLPKTIKAHCFLLHCFWKWKSRWNLSLSGEETSGILSWQTSSPFQRTLSSTGPRLKLLFLSPKWLEGCFVPPKQIKIGGCLPR